MNDDGRIAVEGEVPLNLKVRRAESATVDRTPSRRTVQALGLLISGVLLLAASRRRGRFVIPAAAALAGGSLAALASAILSNRRRAAREAIIDERIRQSFPASDPAQP